MPLEGRGGGGGVSPLVFIFSFSSQPCDCLLLRVPRTSTPLGGGLAKVPTGKRTRASALYMRSKDWRSRGCPEFGCIYTIPLPQYLKDVASDAIMFLLLQKPCILASLSMLAGRFWTQRPQISSARSIFRREARLPYTWSFDGALDSLSLPWLQWHTGLGAPFFSE